MKQVELSKKATNPFYGLRNTLLLYQNGTKQITEAMLTAAYAECRNDKEKREMFYSLLFSIGDITARQHFIFRNEKVDSGGNSARENFKIILDWMFKNYPTQFEKFLFGHLFNEYVNFDNLIGMRIQTKKKSNVIQKTINPVEDDSRFEMTAKYIASLIKSGSVSDQMLVAKFLTRPRLSKRSGHRTMLPATKKLMQRKEYFLKRICDLVGFTYEQKHGYTNFHELYEWKKQYTVNLESYLFSSGKILDLDQQEFMKWLDGVPASARFRVKKRLDNNKKWEKLLTWYHEWETYKETKQTEQRVLEEKVRQQVATTDDVIKLEKVKKEASVTVGAVNFQQMFVQIINGTIDKIKVQPFLDKVNLPYNTLVFVDDSGSMNSMYYNEHLGFTPRQFASFIAAITLMKNPDDGGRDLIGFFSRDTRFVNRIRAMQSPTANRLMLGATQYVDKPLYDPQLHFLDNLRNIRLLADAMNTGNGTNISSIPTAIHEWTKGDPEKIEALMRYPVWTIITDGNWNNLSSPESSLNDFLTRCQKYLGYKPFIIAIDVAGTTSANADRFSGIENFIYLTANPAQIEQMLTNMMDIDVVDVYTPLLSLYRSNRYAAVRNLVG